MLMKGFEPPSNALRMRRVSVFYYYKWVQAEPSPQELLKAQVMERISFHFQDTKGRYGSPKITYLLHQEGFRTTERTVSSYMQEMGLRSCVARRFRIQTTDSNHENPVAPNHLNQQFTVLRPNQVWVADITYIACREGRLYLASILDLCTREIVGYRLGDRMTTDLVLGALEDAYAKKKPPKGLMHHSDRARSTHPKITARKSNRTTCRPA